MAGKKLFNAVVAILGVAVSTLSAHAHPLHQGSPKYLIAWMSDQYMDGRNVSPLDGILGLPSGALPDADFLAVLDANPLSPTYGQVVNTAEMPAVYGQHLLSVTENFVDGALDIALKNSTDPNAPADLAAVGRTLLDDDILGGVPNFNSATNGLPSVVPAPSSVLNEAHHHSVVPTAHPNGAVAAYYRGLISANIFGCDITDPTHIKPAPNSTLENIPLHADAKTNLCGLTVSGAVHNTLTGADDLEWNPVNGHYYTTMMGAGGNRDSFSSTGVVPVSLPPVLTTPGGVQELDPFTGAVIGEYSAVPKAPVPGHGKYVNGADITPKDKQGTTPLLYAAANGHTEIVRLLLEKGARLRAQDVSGANALMLAANHGHLDVMKLLLDRGLDIDAADDDGSTALLVALQSKQPEAARLLIERGADVNVGDELGNIPLPLAAKMGDVAIVNLLIEKGANLSARDSNGNSPMIYAIWQKNLALVKLYLDHNVDIETAFMQGARPLMIAAGLGNRELVEFFLKRGAKLETRDGGGSTALTYAARTDKGDIVKYLLQQGAEVNTRDTAGRTPLIIAATTGSLEAMKALFASSADLNAKDAMGRSVLQWAVEQKRTAAVQLLIAAIPGQNQGTLTH